MDMSDVFDRIVFFNDARRRCEAVYGDDLLDVINLTRWGSALMELATLQSHDVAMKMLHDSISKLEEALKIDPKMAETLWCLGNAMMALAFLFSDAKEAGSYFDKASDCFTKASEEDPSCSLFRNSLEVVAKAPILHAELHNCGKGQQGVASPITGLSDSSLTETTTSATTKKKKKSNDLKYDVMGWCILVVGIVAWLELTENHGPPKPPQP